MFGLIFFRCETFGKAATIISKMFTWQMGASPTGLYGLAVLLPIAAWWSHIGPNPFEMKHDWRGWQLSGVTALFLLAMVSITAGTSRRSCTSSFDMVNLGCSRHSGGSTR